MQTIKTSLDIDLQDAATYELDVCLLHTRYFQDAGLAWSSHNKRRKVIRIPLASIVKPTELADIVQQPEQTHSGDEHHDGDDSETQALTALGLPLGFIGGKSTRSNPELTTLVVNDVQPSPETEHEPQQEGEEQSMDTTAMPRWQEAYDASTGHYYYYCEETQTTQWEPPSEAYIPLPPDWESPTVDPAHMSPTTTITTSSPGAQGDVALEEDSTTQVTTLISDLGMISATPLDSTVAMEITKTPAADTPLAAESQQQKPARRSPYDVAVESYKQHHGWFSDDNGNEHTEQAQEQDHYRATGQWMEEDHMQTPLLPKGMENAGRAGTTITTTSAAGNEEEGHNGIHPTVQHPVRMETTGLMPRIPTPCGVHLRFDDDSSGGEEEQKQPHTEQDNVDADDDATKDSENQDLELVHDLQDLALDTNHHSHHASHDSTDRRKKKKKKKGNNSNQHPKPPLPHHISKYWRQRYSLFSRYDQGIAMDETAWYSVTPEIIAWHHAKRLSSVVGPNCVAVDPFAGVGGNIIQLALTCSHVIAVEMDEQRVAALRQNARVYDVEDKMEIIHGDFFKVVDSIKADVALFSPPWGGPKYSSTAEYDPECMGESSDESSNVFQLSKLIDLAFTTMGCKAVVAWLPRNTNLQRLEETLPLSVANLTGKVFFEVERAVLNGFCKGISVYYGLAAKDQGLEKFKVTTS